MGKIFVIGFHRKRNFGKYFFELWEEFLELIFGKMLFPERIFLKYFGENENYFFLKMRLIFMKKFSCVDQKSNKKFRLFFLDFDLNFQK